MSTVRLPSDGRLLGPRFVQWKYLVFHDKEGKNCFENRTHEQIIGTAVNEMPEERSVEYAKILQKGTWD